MALFGGWVSGCRGSEKVQGVRTRKLGKSVQTSFKHAFTHNTVILHHYIVYWHVLYVCGACNLQLIAYAFVGLLISVVKGGMGDADEEWSLPPYVVDYKDDSGKLLKQCKLCKGTVSVNVTRSNWHNHETSAAHKEAVARASAPKLGPMHAFFKKSSSATSTAHAPLTATVVDVSDSSGTSCIVLDGDNEGSNGNDGGGAAQQQRQEGAAAERGQDEEDATRASGTVQLDLDDNDGMSSNSASVTASTGVLSASRAGAQQAMPQAQLCKGYKPEWGGRSFYLHYPFALHKMGLQSVVWDVVDVADGRVRHIKCNNMPIQQGKDICSQCNSLSAEDSYLTEVRNRALQDEASPSWKYALYTLAQFEKRMITYRDKYSSARLENWNLTRKASSAATGHSLLENIIYLIASKQVHRAGHILSTALERGMSMRAVHRLLEDVAGRFGGRRRGAQYTDEEVELSLLMLMLGGPFALNILQQTHGLPSYSTARRAKAQMQFLITSRFADLVGSIQRNLVNMMIASGAGRCPRQLVIDEVAIKHEAVPCMRTRNMLGLCSDHFPDGEMDCSVASYAQMQILHSKLAEGNTGDDAAAQYVHLGQSASVIAVHALGGIETGAIPVQAHVTCGSSKQPAQEHLLSTFMSVYKKHHLLKVAHEEEGSSANSSGSGNLSTAAASGAANASAAMAGEGGKATAEQVYGPIFCIGTDGHAARRAALHALCKSSVSECFPGAATWLQGTLFMRQTIWKDYGVVPIFDPKHIYKRLRTALGRSKGIRIGGIVVTRDLLMQYLRLVPMPRPEGSTQAASYASDAHIQLLIKPADAMRVPSCLELFSMLSSFASAPLLLAPAGSEAASLNEPGKPLYFDNPSTHAALATLGRIVLLLLSLMDMKLALTSQLRKWSELGHLLAILYEGNGAQQSFIPGVQYHDIQNNVAAYYVLVAMSMQWAKENSCPLTVMLLEYGSDGIEELFAKLRTQLHSGSAFNAVELQSRIVTATSMLKILNKNPSFRQKHKDHRRDLYCGGSDVLRVQDVVDRHLLTVTGNESPEFLQVPWMQGRGDAVSWARSHYLIPQPSDSDSANVRTYGCALFAEMFKHGWTLANPGGRYIGVQGGDDDDKEDEEEDDNDAIALPTVGDEGPHFGDVIANEELELEADDDAEQHAEGRHRNYIQVPGAAGGSGLTEMHIVAAWRLLTSASSTTKLQQSKNRLERVYRDYSSVNASATFVSMGSGAPEEARLHQGDLVALMARGGTVPVSTGAKEGEQYIGLVVGEVSGISSVQGSTIASGNAGRLAASVSSVSLLASELAAVTVTCRIVELVDSVVLDVDAVSVDDGAGSNARSIDHGSDGGGYGGTGGIAAGDTGGSSGSGHGGGANDNSGGNLQVDERELLVIVPRSTVKLAAEPNKSVQDLSVPASSVLPLRTRVEVHLEGGLGCARYVLEKDLKALQDALRHKVAAVRAGKAQLPLVKVPAGMWPYRLSGSSILALDTGRPSESLKLTHESVVKCHICHASGKAGLMRQHVAGHVANAILAQLPGSIRDPGDLKPNVCGFCGRNTDWDDAACCYVGLTADGTGLDPQSSCPSFHRFQLKTARTAKGDAYCCNVPMRCAAPGCGMHVWSYCMLGHMKAKHPHASIPPTAEYNYTPEHMLCVLRCANRASKKLENAEMFSATGTGSLQMSGTSTASVGAGGSSYGSGAASGGSGERDGAGDSHGIKRQRAKVTTKGAVAATSKMPGKRSSRNDSDDDEEEEEEDDDDNDDDVGEEEDGREDEEDEGERDGEDLQYGDDDDDEDFGGSGAAGASASSSNAVAAAGGSSSSVPDSIRSATHNGVMFVVGTRVQSKGTAFGPGTIIAFRPTVDGGDPVVLVRWDYAPSDVRESKLESITIVDDSTKAPRPKKLPRRLQDADD